MDFGNIERITESIFSYDKLNLNVVCTFGRSSSTKTRLDGLYYYEYSSNKYSNLNRVGCLKFNISKYLTFEYTNKNNKEELYISQFNIYELKSLAEELLSLIDLSKETHAYEFDEDDNIYISSAYENKIFRCECIGGKTLAFSLSLIDYEDSKESSSPGLIIYLNDPVLSVVLDYNASIALLNIIIEFDIIASSERLSLMTYMFNLSKNLNIEDNNHVGKKRIIPTKRNISNLKSSINNNENKEEEN